MSDVERHEDGRPREWDWVLVCAVGHESGTWAACKGHLRRESDEMGTRLLCVAHRGAGKKEGT